MGKRDHAEDRRSILGKFVSAFCITAIVPKVLTAQGGGGKLPTCTTEDANCALLNNGGQGPGHFRDGDCAVSLSDLDCGTHTGTFVPTGHSDQDCATTGYDTDCGIQAVPGLGHEDNDCSMTSADADCGISSGFGTAHTDQDCAVTQENSDLGPLDPPSPPEDPLL